jgi:hypothetical protein
VEGAEAALLEAKATGKNRTARYRDPFAEIAPGGAPERS